MADEIKIKETGGVARTEPLHTRVKKVENKQVSISTERTQISEEAKILREFVPKVMAAIEKERDIGEAKPATTSEIANSLIGELIKTILAKKFIE